MKAAAVFLIVLGLLLGLGPLAVSHGYAAQDRDRILVEVLCDEPGLGQLAWRAVAGRDLPLLTTLTLLFTAVTGGMSLLAECLLPEAGG